eukprot:109882_1
MMDLNQKKKKRKLNNNCNNNNENSNHSNNSQSNNINEQMHFDNDEKEEKLIELMVCDDNDDDENRQFATAQILTPQTIVGTSICPTKRYTLLLALCDAVVFEFSQHNITAYDSRQNTDRTIDQILMRKTDEFDHFMSVICTKIEKKNYGAIL